MPDLPAPTRVVNSRSLLGLCVLVGIVAGLGAAGFLALLDAASAFFMGALAHYHPPHPGLEGALFEFGHQVGAPTLRWMLLILPILGGLVSGFIVFSFAPEAEGHGTDAAIEAYHFKDGAVRARVPFIKAITSAITIGTGGSGGREGPIAQIGAGFGSVLGALTRVAPAQRRVLMASGMAAGVGAIFHAPFAGALFAAEVMYSGPDMEHEILVPAFITSITAYSLFGAIFGFHPLFLTPAYHFSHVEMLLPYLVLGGAMALAGWFFTRSFYDVRRLMFHRLRVPNHFKPAIGGIAVGLIGFVLPEALGTGYGVLQACLNQDAAAGIQVLDLPSGTALLDLLPAGMAPAYAAAILLALIGVGKTLTTAFAIGSGGSGGVFGPAVVVGGAFGGAIGMLAQHWLPGLPVHPGAFAIVGMAGFFAGAANTPISTILMVSEMTGNYDLLVPSMLVCILAFSLSKRTKLYAEQLPSRLDAPTKMGNMARAILRRLTVHDALRANRRTRNIPIVSARATFAELTQLHYHSEHGAYAMVDDEGRLVGVIDDDDIRHLLAEGDLGPLLLAEDLAHPPKTVVLNQSILSLVNIMAEQGAAAVVVMSDDDPTKPIAILDRGDIIAVYNAQVTLPAGTSGA